MRFDFFTIWFIISPFIILFLYNKNKDTKSKVDVILDKVNNEWDKGYIKLIDEYDTVDNFLSLHKKDFELLRNYLLNIYFHISAINRLYMYDTDNLLKCIEEYSNEEITNTIKKIKSDSCIAVDSLLSDLNNFILDETRAHAADDLNKIIDVLADLDAKYSNNTIYDEVDPD